MQEYYTTQPTVKDIFQSLCRFSGGKEDNECAKKMQNK